MSVIEIPAIQVRLLGRIEVLTSTTPVVSFRSSRVPALLGLLVAEPGSHPREYIAHRLWPNGESEVCRHNLRQTLVYLRNSLGPEASEAISATRTHLGIAMSGISSDVDLLLSTERFQERNSKRALCERAVDLCEGIFLPGIDDEWVRDHRSHFAQVYLRALVFLADSEMDERPSKALEYANRAVMEEPLMDGPRSRKLRALTRLGERAAAQLEFESFSELLDQELGIGPSEAVREALNDMSRKRPLAGIPDRENVSQDLTVALDNLGTGDRPQLAVDLAIAATPHWIEAGTPGLGVEKLRQAVSRSGVRLLPTTRARAELAIVDLTMARGDLGEASILIDKLEANDLPLDDRMRIRMLLIQARLWLAVIDGRTASVKARAALALAESCGDMDLELDSLVTLAMAASHSADYPEALRVSDRAALLANRLGRKLSYAGALLAKTFALEVLGDREECEESIRKGLLAIHGLPPRQVASYRLSWARLFENLDLMDDAETEYRNVLADVRESENRFREAIGLTYLGDLVGAKGCLHEALAHHTAALALLRELGLKLAMATSLRGLGRAYCGLNELNAAREALSESAHLYLSEDAIPGYASVLLAMAELEERARNFPLATRLARRSRKLLRGMTPFEVKSIGKSGPGLAAAATELIGRCTPSVT